MKKKVITLFLATALALSFVACGKKAAKIQTTQYSELVGVAEGSVDFADADEPQISIKEIRSYVGEDIDYSSGIEVKNVDSYDDFQMWVDATGVDIYAEGKYTAVYRFVYDGKETEKAVSVTILAKEEEGNSVNTANSADSQNGSSQNGSSQNGSSQNGDTSGGSDGDGGSQGGNSDSTNSDANSAGDNTGGSGANDGQSDGNSDANDGQSDGSNATNGGQGAANSAGNTSQSGGSSTADSGQNSANNSGNSGQSAANSGGSSGNTNTATTASAAKEIITSKRSTATKTSTIGYTNIELLSGKYVKIKCTSAKYIVSTRTDTSQTVKNNTTYNVSKLIITYNTGDEQILETVETAVR